MSLFGSSLTSPSSGLTAANISKLIQETLNAQRVPIHTLTTRKDELNVRKAIYSDLKSKLLALNTIVENLMMPSFGDEDKVFDDMLATSSDTDVLTATATLGSPSARAASGKYTIEVTNLAKVYRVRSDQQTSSSADLNMNGTFTLNGVSIIVQTTDSLEDIMDGINAAEYIKQLFDVGLEHESELDNGNISEGLEGHFTGNGITLSSSATVSIEEEGSEWLITDDGKKYYLREEGGQINIYEDVEAVRATIVDNYLVLEAASTGTSNAITFTDTDSILSQLGMLSGEGSFAIAPFTLTALDATITPAAGLDGSYIADELKTAFTTNGITLSAGAAVTVVEANERWKITDGDGTYYVENYDTGAGNNRLKIYTTAAPFTLTALDATITAAAGLDGGYIADELNTAFTTNGITLSNPTVTQDVTNERWKITDNGKTYYVENYYAEAGDNRLRIYTESEPLQAAEDANFTVNGISITRGSNTGLDDVISGVTLSLLSEAEAELEVSPDYATISGKISAFVSNLNSTLSYLKAKTGTTVDQENKTYTRGSLAGETIFSMLRSDLMGAVQKQVTAGSLKSLEDIGITIGDGLEISVDTGKLNSEMQYNFEDVKDLFEGVMQEFLEKLEPFTITTSSSNTIDLYSNSVETRMENIDNRIERMEKMLEAREEMLIKQYSGLYMQSMRIQNEQLNLFSIYASFSVRA